MEVGLLTLPKHAENGLNQAQINGLLWSLSRACVEEFEAEVRELRKLVRLLVNKRQVLDFLDLVNSNFNKCSPIQKCMVVECYDAMVQYHLSVLKGTATKLLDRAIGVMCTEPTHKGMGQAVGSMMLNIHEFLPDEPLTKFVLQITKSLNTTTPQQRDECYTALRKVMPKLSVTREIMDGILGAGLTATAPSKAIGSLIEAMAKKNPRYTRRCWDSIAEITNNNTVGFAMNRSPDTVIPTLSLFSSSALDPDMLGVTRRSNQLRSRTKTRAKTSHLNGTGSGGQPYTISGEFRQLFEKYPIATQHTMAVPDQFQYHKALYSLIDKHHSHIGCISAELTMDLLVRLLDLAARNEYNALAVMCIKGLIASVSDNELLLDVKFTVLQRYQQEMEEKGQTTKGLEQCLMPSDALRQSRSGEVQ